MKTFFLYSIGLLLLLGIAACKKDNYAAPGVTFSGRITYQGEPVGVATNQVYFELWQSGYGKLSPINVNIDQEGHFSALLFNGAYRMDLSKGQGPYLPASGHYGDTTDVVVSGAKTLDIEVMPYFMIRDAQYTNTDSVITAAFRLEAIVKDPALVKNITQVYLFESTLTLLDIQNNKTGTTVDIADIPDLDHVSVQVKIPADQYGKQAYVFARIGVKLDGIDDMLYGPATKINL